MSVVRLCWCVSLLFLTACQARVMPPEIVTIQDIPRVVAPNRNEVIVLDAGHGGRDPGSMSHREDYEEKSLTLSTVFMVQDHLKKLGYKTVLTRNHDIYVPLHTRAEIANDLNANLFVSIHYNFSTSCDVEGVEVYVYKEEKTPNNTRIVQSKRLAQTMLCSVIERTGAHSRGVKQANFAVIRETQMPAILIEAGFLSNPHERDRIHDPQYLRQLSWGIAKGIDKYLR